MNQEQEVTIDLKLGKLELIETQDYPQPKEAIVSEEDDATDKVDLKAFLAESTFWKWGGRQLIHLAAERGRLDVVEKVVKNGISVDIKDNDGWTPLIYAAWMGHFEIVKFLVAKNAKINEFDTEGYSAMLRAMESGHNEIVEYLNSRNLRNKLQIINSP